MESKFVSVPSCFKVPKIKMKQRTKSWKKSYEVSWCFLLFLSLFNEELLISLCFLAQPSELFWLLVCLFFAWFAQRLLVSWVVLTPPKTNSSPPKMVVGRLTILSFRYGHFFRGHVNWAVIETLVACVIQGIIITTHLYRDYNKQLEGSLLTNQWNEMSQVKKGFDHCSVLGGVFSGVRSCFRWETFKWLELPRQKRP